MGARRPPGLIKADNAPVKENLAFLSACGKLADVRRWCALRTSGAVGALRPSHPQVDRPAGVRPERWTAVLP